MAYYQVGKAGQLRLELGEGGERGGTKDCVI